MSKTKLETGPAYPVNLPPITFEQLNTIVTFQRLWTYIAVWMRAFIHSTMFNTPNREAVSEKLYSLPQDFYDIFSSYYGTQYARQFVNLLSNFIMNGMQLIEGMRNNDQEQVNASTVRWYQIADQMARFLSSVNILWDYNQWRFLLYQYIRAKIDELVAISLEDFHREIEMFEIIEDITFIIGSYMARGLISARPVEPRRK